MWFHDSPLCMSMSLALSRYKKRVVMLCFSCVVGAQLGGPAGPGFGGGGSRYCGSVDGGSDNLALKQLHVHETVKAKGFTRAGSGPTQ